MLIEFSCPARSIENHIYSNYRIIRVFPKIDHSVRICQNCIYWSMKYSPCISWSVVELNFSSILFYQNRVKSLRNYFNKKAIQTEVIADFFFGSRRYFYQNDLRDARFPVYFKITNLFGESKLQQKYTLLRFIGWNIQFVYAFRLPLQGFIQDTVNIFSISFYSGLWHANEATCKLANFWILS